MKLKDIADMEEYLENRCYCPYEIYDYSGFFFRHFYPDTECDLLISGERRTVHGTFVIANSEGCPAEIIYIEHSDGKVESCVRIDATENNRKQVIDFMNGNINSMLFDEYISTKTKEKLDEIFSIADAVMI